MNVSRPIKAAETSPVATRDRLFWRVVGGPVSPDQMKKSWSIIG